MMGDSKSVKVNRKNWCFVPGCTNTSVNNPEKVFMTVPNNLQRKKLWFSAARRKLKNVSKKTHFYCCEDHFKLEEDMDNYWEYRLSKVKIRMKPGVVPHIFTCQPDRKTSDPRQSNEKRAGKRNISEILQETGMSSPENFPNNPDPKPGISSEVHKNTISSNLKIDFCCQTNLIRYRSKGIQVSRLKETRKNRATSPITFAVPVIPPKRFKDLIYFDSITTSSSNPGNWEPHQGSSTSNEKDN